MPFDKYKDYIYLIGEFVGGTSSNGRKEIDIIPIKWTNVNEENAGECETLYPPPPYNEHVFKKLVRLVKNNEDADLGYSIYPIRIRAFAKNYKEAEMKLGIVTRQSSAFSTGSEMDSDEKARAASKIVRTLSIPKQDVTFYSDIKGFSDTEDETLGSSKDEDERSPTFTPRKIRKMSPKKPEKDKDLQKEVISSDDDSDEVPQSSSLLPGPLQSNLFFTEKIEDKLKQSKLINSPEKDPATPARHQQIRSCTPKQSKNSNTTISKMLQNGSSAQPQKNSFIENVITKYSDILSKKGGESISKKDYLALMFRGVNNIIEFHVSDMKKDCNDIVELAHRKGSSNNASSNTILNAHMLAKKYNLTLPLQTVPEFTAFCELLLTNEEFSKDFNSSMCSLFSKLHSLTKNLTAILKEYLHRDLATQFTAVKKSSTKELILKDTVFSTSVQNFIDGQRSLGNERLQVKEYEKALSEVLPNAKDWSGGRSERKKKENTEQAK